MAVKTALFVHGLWLHATSWQPWLDTFVAAGYSPSAPGWPGDPDTVAEARANPAAVAGHGIDDVVAHYGAIIDEMADKPVLVGHSIGGLVVAKLLGQDRGRGGVAIDAAPIKGALPQPISALRSSFPVLRNPANRDKAISLTAAQFRFGFGNAITSQESDDLYQKWNIPGPGKPLVQPATGQVDPQSAHRGGDGSRGPLLLISGGHGHRAPAATAKSRSKPNRHSAAVTELLDFRDRGHSLVIDSGWSEVADACLTWLGKQGL